jgi:hypothetical protein
MRPDTFQTLAVTTSGLVHSGPCAFGGALIGEKDGVNNMTVTIYDGITSSTDYTEIVPTTIIDGTVKGVEGVSENHKIQCLNGIYVEIEGAGTARVTVRYRPIG